jgi:hypothetical protein
MRRVPPRIMIARLRTSAMSGCVLKMGRSAITVFLVRPKATVTGGTTHILAPEGLQRILDADSDPSPVASDFAL